MKLRTRNPATGAWLPALDYTRDTDVERALSLSQEAFTAWKMTSFAERATLMSRLADLLTAKKQDLANLMAVTMGKPVAAGVAEIEKCVWVCHHYRDHAAGYLTPRPVNTELLKATVYYLPLGTVFAIMPWNFPFWQVFRFAAPALMAGNTAILKHAPISASCGEAIAGMMLEAGYPRGVFQHLILNNDQAARVIAHPAIIAVTLTGSEGAGRSVAATAGAHLKKVVLELGGSDPYLVLADADIALAARAIVQSRLNNSGQVCIAAKRVIAEAPVYYRLLAQIRVEMASRKMGDPLDPTVDMGPMAREDLRNTLHDQVTRSVDAGARLREGGYIPDGPGFWYPPTLLEGVLPGMPAFDEELFGPVIALIPCQSMEEGIRLANDTRYGLGGAVFTADAARGEEIARHGIESGVCNVNCMVASDPRLPFGGVKSSGFGRELSGEGILEFVNIKTVGVYAE